MTDTRAVWKHEVKQADKVARGIIEVKGVKLDWRIFFLPIFIRDVIYFRKSLFLTKRNLLFTKRQAYKAAQEIRQGKTHAWAIRSIEIKTKDILDKDRKGLYSEKIRRKQLPEIQLLTDHYLRLLDTKHRRYSEMVKSVYPSRKSYLSFLDKLHSAEQEVIQAATASVRKGSRKERIRWFKKVQDMIRKVRMADVEKIFPPSA